MSINNLTARKAQAYQERAQQCRELAKQMDTEEHRQTFLRIAETWDRMAADEVWAIETRPTEARA
jgi:hypothetical protein